MFKNKTLKVTSFYAATNSWPLKNHGWGWKTLNDLISWDAATFLPYLKELCHAMSVVSGVVLPPCECFCRGYTMPMNDSHVCRQGKFLVGCDGGRSNVRWALMTRWAVWWEDDTLRRKVTKLIMWWFSSVHILHIYSRSFWREKDDRPIWLLYIMSCDIYVLGASKVETINSPTGILRICFFSNASIMSEFELTMKEKALNSNLHFIIRVKPLNNKKYTMGTHVFFLFL